MKGLWSFYDKNGNLKVQFNCTSNTNFTPLLLVNNRGDTILKNGNGKFTFNSISDLPDIFPAGKSYHITGEVVNGKKEGVFAYSINGLKEGSTFQENYQNGRFEKAIDVNPFFNQSEERSFPYSFLNLKPEKLLRTEKFYANSLIFGSLKNREEKILKFLLLKEIPEIVSEAASYEDNREIFHIISVVIRKTIVNSYVQNISFANPPSAVKTRLLSFNIPASTLPLAIDCTVEIDIDTTGYITNTSFKGNLDITSIRNINFYLEHLSNSVPFEENRVRKRSKLVVRLYTVVRNFENEDGVK